MYHHPHGQEGKKSLSMGVLVLIFGDNSILVIIQHDKARSASDRPATRDAQHPESGVLNSYVL